MTAIAYFRVLGAATLRPDLSTRRFGRPSLSKAAGRERFGSKPLAVWRMWAKTILRKLLFASREGYSLHNMSRNN